MQAAVLGAGSCGTALALVLSQNKNISLTIYHHNNYYIQIKLLNTLILYRLMKLYYKR